MSEKHLPQVLNLNQKDNLYFLVGSSGKEMATALTLENPSCQIVCFKVKISKIAQKLFNVSPIHGMIDPGGKVEIEIRCKCEQIKEFGKPIKFLIRSMFVADGTFGEDELWKNADETQFMDSKLECVFPNNDEAAKYNCISDVEGFKSKSRFSRFFNGDFFQHKYQRF